MGENSKIEWRSIQATGGMYHISNTGLVRNAKSRILLRGSVDRYRFVRLKVAGKWKKLYTHRLIAAAFVGNCDQCHVNHINGNKLDNSVSNLELVTQRENNRHAYRTGLVQAGEKHHWSKLTTEAVADIRKHRGQVLQRVLAQKHGVTPGAISAIQLGRAWNSEERCR